MMERFPDIEIYLASVSLEALNKWLGSALTAPPLSPAGKGQWKTRGQYQGDSVPVLLVDKAADGFASLWFDRPRLRPAGSRSPSNRSALLTWRLAPRR